MHGSDQGGWRPWPTADAPEWHVRRFGAADDLDLDFAGSARPDLLTRLLVHCLRRPDGTPYAEVEIWDWTISQRLQGLLATWLANDIRRLSVEIRCQEQTCKELMELALDLGAFVRLEDPARFECSPSPGHRLDVRLPTGSDQRHWLAQQETSAGAMARRLVQDLNGTPPDDAWSVPEAWIGELSEALEEHDPLTALRLCSCCPSCGTACEVEFDLEARLLVQLQRQQQDVLRQVHWLASRYHWSEEQILSLPAWRRAFYLAALGMEGCA